MKVCELCGEEIATRDGENRCLKCDTGAETPAKRKDRNADRRARDDAMRSLGLTKVRGAMGGTYWE